MYCTQLSLIYLCPAAHQWKLLLIPFLLICYGLLRSRSEFAREEWPVMLSWCSLSRFDSSFPLTPQFNQGMLLQTCTSSSSHLLTLQWLAFNTVVSSRDWFSWFGSHVQGFLCLPLLIHNNSSCGWNRMAVTCSAILGSYSPAAPSPLLWQLVWKLLPL